MNEDTCALGRVLMPAPPVKPSALKRLAEIAARMPAEADTILLGDSLAAAFLPELYGTAFPGRRVFNFGLPGDRIQNTLWRLDHVAVGHLRPREAVLLLGTNNLGDGDPSAAISAGLDAVLERIGTLWNAPHLVLVTIPRRGEPPGLREAERRALNAALAGGLSGRGTPVDADAALAAAANEPPSLLPDLLHLSPAGYARLAAALRACLDAGR